MIARLVHRVLLLAVVALLAGCSSVLGPGVAVTQTGGQMAPLVSNTGDPEDDIGRAEQRVEVIPGGRDRSPRRRQRRRPCRVPIHDRDPGEAVGQERAEHAFGHLTRPQHHGPLPAEPARQRCRHVHGGRAHRRGVPAEHGLPPDPPPGREASPARVLDSGASAADAMNVKMPNINLEPRAS